MAALRADVDRRAGQARSVRRRGDGASRSGHGRAALLGNTATVAASPPSDRSARAQRLLQSIVAGEPDASLLAGGFQYEQHFGNTAGLYEGEAGLRRWVESFYDVWERAQLTVEGVKEGEDWLALDIRVEVRARQTGIEVDIRATQFFRFDGQDQITHMEAYNEPAEAALAAARHEGEEGSL
jgi:hypothetical protein